MKKILTAAIALVLFMGAAQAQTKNEEAKEKHKGNHEMMRQLNLSEDQKAKFKEMHQQEKKEMGSLKNSGLDKDGLKAKRSELHQKYKDQFQSVLTTSQKEQMKTASNNRKSKGDLKGDKTGKSERKVKDFKKELNLTSVQEDKMQQMRKDSKTQFETIRNDKSLTDAQRKEKMKEVKKQQLEQMKSVLTKEQMDQMKSMHKSHGDSKK